MGCSSALLPPDYISFSWLGCFKQVVKLAHANLSTFWIQWHSHSPLSRQNWTSTPKNPWRFKSAPNSATGGSKSLKQDPSPASFLLRTAGFEELAGQDCLFSWVTQYEAFPQILSSQENKVLCTTEVVYQMTGCTVPAKSRKVTFNTLL